MTDRLAEAKKYVKSSQNDEGITDIAWKFVIGDTILSIADQAGIDKVEPESLIDIFEQDILIGDKICVLVRKANSEHHSDGNSSESQPHPDNISGPGL